MRQHAAVLWFHAPLPVDRSTIAGEGNRHMDIQSVAPKLFERTAKLVELQDKRFDPNHAGFLKAYVPNDRYPFRAAQQFLSHTDHVDVDVVVDPNIGPSWDMSRTSKRTGVWFNEALRNADNDTPRKEWWKFWKQNPTTSSASWNAIYPETLYLMGRWQTTVRSHINQEAARINNGYYAGYFAGQSFALLYVVPHGIPFELIYGSPVNDEHAQPFGGFVYVYEIPEDEGYVHLLHAERHEDLRGKKAFQPAVIQGDL